MDSNTPSQQLTTLKARAAKINSEIHSSPTKEIKKARVAEYMHISAKIAELKNEIASAKPTAPVDKNGKRREFVKVATLLFPAEKRVQYFATTLGIVELMITLQEVFEESIPVVSAYYSVPTDQEASIPDKWFELVAPDEITS